MIRNSSGFVFHLETHLPLRRSTDPIRARLNLTFIVITRRHEARNKFFKSECSLSLKNYMREYPGFTLLARLYSGDLCLLDPKALSKDPRAHIISVGFYHSRCRKC